MKKGNSLLPKSALLSVSFTVILLVILSLMTTKNQIDGTRGDLTGPMNNMQEYAQDLLQKSNSDILFIENLGQIKDTEGEARPEILFFTRSEGVDVYLTKSGMTYVFRKNDIPSEKEAVSYNTQMKNWQGEHSYYRMDMAFEGMNEDITIRKEMAVQQKYNYYTAGHPDGLSPTAFKKVTIENLYEGIDLVYYEKEGRMKYDFVIKAGADPSQIRMKYEGAESMFIDDEGNVVITTSMGEIREEKPYSYTESTKKEIESRYEVKDNMVWFDVGDFNQREDVIIDPVRTWATYYGGYYKENTRGICTDAKGNIYLAGRANDITFPTHTLPGAYTQTTFAGGVYDAVILKFNKNGERIWATYYGGSDTDEGNGICIDDAGNLYVIGETASNDFPTQILTGAYNQTAKGDTLDAFILKFDTSGVRQWATYYGGNGLDRGFDITTDNSNHLYVSGETRSTDFPTQTLAGAYNQTTSAGSSDLFILKFDSNSARQWATYYGGSGCDGRCGSFWVEIGGMCTDNSGNLYVTGSTISSDFPTQSLPGAYNQSTLVGNYIDAFILKFNSNGVRKWATYYGGKVYDGGNDIITDASGALYLTGFTYSSDFPTYALPGAYNQASLAGGSDVTIMKFDSSGVRLWATCYGGNGGANEHGTGIDLDNSGSIYISGTAQADANFPLHYLPGAYNQSTQTGGYDIIILKLDSGGVRQWATYYGGSGGDRAWGSCTDTSGNLYITGLTSSEDFPNHFFTGAYNQDTLGGINDLYILRFDESYCHSWGSQLGHVYTSEVNFGDISNPSVGSDYSDFTALSTNVTQNTSYPISLSFWKDVGSHKADWKVWIDYNIDGDFEDAGELVFSANDQRKTVNGTITIPSNTSVGMAKMRVSVEDGDGSFGPCDILNWGEVEDYSINLQAYIPLPPVADFEGTPTTVTVGNSVDFTDLSQNDPTSWSWSFVGGTPANSTEQNPTVTYNTEGTYQVSLTATNTEGSDSETKIDYITVEAVSGCSPVSNVFPDDPLTHSGTGSTSTTYDFGAPGHTDVTCVISGLNAKTNGKPDGRYIDSLTITYTDAGGTKTYGTFSGTSTSSANIDIDGPVLSVTITLEDAYDGDPPGTLSVDPGDILSCPPVGALKSNTSKYDLGVDDFSESNLDHDMTAVRLYPNPAHNQLTVRYHQSGEYDVLYTITDIKGHTVFNLPSQANGEMQSEWLDVSQLPPGIYFLHIRLKDQLISKRFAILR